MAQRRLRRGAPQPVRPRKTILLFSGLLGAALLWYAVPDVLRRLEFFRVRRLEISGLQYLAPATIIAAMGLDDRASVFDDLIGAGEGLRSLPGVRSAVVRRRLPGTIEVMVEEAVPVALAPRGGGMALLDSTGSVLPFDPAATAPDLPIAVTADRVLAQVLARVQAHHPGLFDRIDAARRVEGDVMLELDGRRLWLSPEVTAEDIRAVMAVVEDLARLGRNYGELDGRFAGQVIVRRAGA